MLYLLISFFFFFNDTATTEIYTLSLHDALPIWLILLSNTYQQSSDGEGRYAQIDPDNRLLWKMNRQRLDFEELRDSLLALAGKLDFTEGGHAVDIVDESFSPRRTIYGFVERSEERRVGK